MIIMKSGFVFLIIFFWLFLIVFGGGGLNIVFSLSLVVDGNR